MFGLQTRMSSSSLFVSDVPDSALEDTYVNLRERKEIREGVEGVADLLCRQYINNTTLRIETSYCYQRKTFL